MSYLVPKTLEELLVAIEVEPAKFVAGGTDHYPSLKEGKQPDRVLDLTKVRELRGISRTEHGHRIGAATTWTEIIKTPLPRCFDGLKAAAREIGSIQIQNSGTIAGNICNASPAADGVPPLLALTAKVETISATDTRTIPLEEFITGVRSIDLRDGELVSAIIVPHLPDNAVSTFQKLGSRKYLVISIVMVATTLWLDLNGNIEDARVAVGSCSPVATRIPELEAALRGMKAGEARNALPIGPGHLNILSPIDDVRASAEYRSHAAEELCRRALTKALSETESRDE